LAIWENNNAIKINLGNPDHISLTSLLLGYENKVPQRLRRRYRLSGSNNANNIVDIFSPTCMSMFLMVRHPGKINCPKNGKELFCSEFSAGFRFEQHIF
jgi:hypothetical protein